MKKLISQLIVLLILATTAASCGSQVVPEDSTAKGPVTSAASTPKSNSPTQDTATREKKWEDLVVEAKKEGRVVVLSLIGPEARQAVTNAFSAKYGIDVEFISGNPNETINKILVERTAGLYLEDAIIDGTSVVTLYGRTHNLLVNLEPVLLLPEVVDPNAWLNSAIPYFDQTHMGIGFLAQYNSCILRNTELVKEGEIKSFLDLLEPRWKDKTTMRDPTVAGAGANLLAMLAISSWDQQRTGDWLSRMLSQQNMVVTRDARLQVEWVARGKYQVGIAVSTDPLVNFLALGAPIAQQKAEEGGILTPSTGGIGMFDKAAHPNAAVVFVNWLLSREGQTAFTSGFGGPSRRNDVKSEGVYGALSLPAGARYYEEDQARMLKKVELQKVWSQIIDQPAKN